MQSYIEFLLRGCDSRNLNLSPLCQLSTSSLLKLQPVVDGTYGNWSTDYSSGIGGPIRRSYPTLRMRREELLTSLTKVTFCLHNNRIFDKDDPTYSAYERDIAVVNIFFGDSTVFSELR